MVTGKIKSTSRLYILGPLLFLMYIDGISQVVKYGKIVLFADDAKLFLTSILLKSVKTCKTILTHFISGVLKMARGSMSVNVKLLH